MFPWNLFQFNKDMQSKMKQMKPDEVNQYVQNMMNKMFSSSFPHNMDAQEMMKNFQTFQPSERHSRAEEEKNNLKYSIFETHKDIFVRIQIESEEWLKELRLYHTSNLLILEHIPSFDDKHSIPLPSLVKKKETTACFKDGILEVKMTKSMDTQFSEVDISEIP